VEVKDIRSTAFQTFRHSLQPKPHSSLRK